MCGIYSNETAGNDKTIYLLTAVIPNEKARAANQHFPLISVVGNPFQLSPVAIPSFDICFQFSIQCYLALLFPFSFQDYR